MNADGLVNDFEQLKDGFLSAVGHELRTPLTATMSSLKLLQSGLVDPSSDKGRRLIDMAVSNSDRLHRLVEGLMDRRPVSRQAS